MKEDVRSENPVAKSTVIYLFSKDRSMQLDATLRSLIQHCKDSDVTDQKVLYVTSNPKNEKQYLTLANEYTQVDFQRESRFKFQLINDIRRYQYVLFLVDDNIFVQDFSVGKFTEYLASEPELLGVSLRLGENCSYCYPLRSEQVIPTFHTVEDDFLKFEWPSAEYDFGYPLEVSSSIYRVNDLLPILCSSEFTNPNTLEVCLSSSIGIFSNQKKFLGCGRSSISFCNPINIVQSTFANRAGEEFYYSPEELSQLFELGYRVDLQSYNKYIPNACHQEVELSFKKLAKPIIAVQKQVDYPNELITFLYANGHLAPSQPIKLHLGCGEQHLDGYVNIDYPASEHTLMNVAADVFLDIAELTFPGETIEEIRLHHVFEHFNRVNALALLIKWHSWLKVGGKLVLETPDLEGSARAILSNASFKTKMGVVRHLVGDQAAHWAYHIDQWFPERFRNTLPQLGYEIAAIQLSSWPTEPYLSNITVVAVKREHVPLAKQIQAANDILWLSTVSPVEKPMYTIWIKQLAELVNASNNSC